MWQPTDREQAEDVIPILQKKSGGRKAVDRWLRASLRLWLCLTGSPQTTWVQWLWTHLAKPGNPPGTVGSSTMEALLQPSTGCPWPQPWPWEVREGGKEERTAGRRHGVCEEGTAVTRSWACSKWFWTACLSAGFCLLPNQTEPTPAEPSATSIGARRHPRLDRAACQKPLTAPRTELWPPVSPSRMQPPIP